VKSSRNRAKQSRLLVDTRWKGEHGIGRFATEVVRRLSDGWAPLAGHWSPTSPMDAANPYRAALSSRETVFSPGFNAGLSRARQVLVLHDLIHLETKEESSVAKTVFYELIVRRAVRRAGIVMTVSDASARAIRKWLGSPTVEIVVVGNGRSSDFAVHGPTHEFEHPTFVYVGNLKPHKNVDVILDAVKLRPDYRLVLVTADVEEANRRVAERGIGSQVEVSTGVTDSTLASIYRGASGVLQPSLLEGFGLPALEAMSCGTSVAYWAGCESVVEICAGTGVVVANASDKSEWADALDRLNHGADAGPLEMPAEWNKLYDWDNVGRKVDETLKRVQRRP